MRDRVRLRLAAVAGPLLAAALCALLAVGLAARPACALDWSALAQPVGDFVGNGANPDGVYAPATINAILGGTPPFDSGTSVTLVRLTVAQQYVRFYNPTDPANPSAAIGSWMMRASEVRGLTAAQIRDKFALPALPTDMVQVNVPTGYALYTGIAAPIAGWGEGGGLQNRAMNTKPPADIAADPFLPAGSFVNAQALAAAPVLSYRAPASGGRGASAMGAYMDTLAPRVGGDLEGVYDALDTLLFTGRGAEVGQAMAQFSPARFEALGAVALRVGALRAAALDTRARILAAGPDSGAEAAGLAFARGLLGLAGPQPGQGRARIGDWDLWLRAEAEYARDSAPGAMPYSSATAATHAGIDRSVSPELVLGLGAGLARTLLDWERDGGDAASTTASLSAYGFWNDGDWFANGELTLDAAFTQARRRISSAVADRVARSTQSGEGASLRLAAGRRLALDSGAGREGWTLSPSAELGYALHRQNPFREHGAGDLDLRVRAATAQTLVAGAELAAGWRGALAGGGILETETALGWRRETPLGARELRAAFAGYAQEFRTPGDTGARDQLLVRAGVSHRDAAGLDRYVRYRGVLGGGLQAHALELGCRREF